MGQTGALEDLATAAGRLVLAALEAPGDEGPARSLSRSAASPSAVRLLRELFTVAVRRCFVRRDPRDVTAYVRDLLDYHALPARGEYARQAEAVLRSALGEPEMAYAVGDQRRFELICLVAGDLVRPPGVASGELHALVRQAERRAERA